MLHLAHRRAAQVRARLHYIVHYDHVRRLVATRPQVVLARPVLERVLARVVVVVEVVVRVRVLEAVVQGARRPRGTRLSKVVLVIVGVLLVQVLRLLLAEVTLGLLRLGQRERILGRRAQVLVLLLEVVLHLLVRLLRWVGSFVVQVPMGLCLGLHRVCRVLVGMVQVCRLLQVIGRVI